VREVSALTGALDAELWASLLLGVFWYQRYTLPLDQAASPDYSLILGEPLIEAVAQFGGVGARTALSVIERVDDGELGLRAAELAASCGPDEGEEMPNWVSNVGEAEITGRLSCTRTCSTTRRPCSSRRSIPVVRCTRWAC
jgi:hypothetical protein